MAQLSKVLGGNPENQSSIPSAYIKWLKAICKCEVREYDSLLSLL